MHEDETHCLYPTCRKMAMEDSEFCPRHSGESTKEIYIDCFGADLPQVAGGLECSLNEFERRCRWWIKNEQAKPDQNTALIGLLADAVRLKREYCDSKRTFGQLHLNSFPPEDC